MRLAPVFGAWRFLADFIATLPLKGYRNLGDVRQPMQSLPQLFQFLADEGTLVSWVTQAVTSLAAHGNAIGLITSRDGYGYPSAVLWLPRTDFWVDDTNPATPVWYYLGRRIDRSELVHIPWVTVPGRTLGLSPIEAFALTVSSGLGAQAYASSWFKNGGIPPGTFKNAQKTITDEQADTMKRRLVAAIRTRQPLVYGADWDYVPITIPPDQAQFVQAQRLSANQIAAIYGIDPTEVGGEPPGSLTYSTEETRQIRRISDVRPWLVRIEAALSALLPERQYVRFNANATVRADLKTRFEVYALRRQIGYGPVDEIRALEDDPPLPDNQGSSPVPLQALTQQAATQRALLTLQGQDISDAHWALPQ